MLDTSVWVREPSAVLSVIHHANDRSIDENNCGCHYYYVPVPFCRLLMPTVLPDGATLLQTVNNYRTIVQDYVRDNRMLFFRCCDHVLRKKKPIETSPTTPQMRRRRLNLVNDVFTGPEHGPC